MGVLSWILLAACMLWSALRFLPAGREAHMPTMPYMIALIRFLWIPYLVIAVWAGLVGSWWQCGVAVAGIVSILAMQVPYWTNMPRERWHHQRGTSHETASDDHRQTARSADAEPTANPPQASGGTYHLMTLNCRYGKASADAIIAAVRERHIDVLALQELSTDLIKRLERGGLRRILPYRQLGTPREKTDNGGFNGIWSRTKPKRGTHGIVSIPAADVPGIMLQTDDGTSVAFASAHTKSPMRGCREWSDGIRSLSALVPMPRKSVSAGTGREERATGSKAGRGGGSAYPDVDIAVLMGDLNADIDHASFRELLRSGFRDAALAQARGHVNTFPSQVPWPRIELDHIMAATRESASGSAAEPARAVAFSGVESFVVEDTDHLALTATMTI